MSEISSDVNDNEVTNNEVSGDGGASSGDVNETQNNDVDEPERDEELSKYLDETYDSYMKDGNRVEDKKETPENKEDADNAEKQAEHIQCRNEDLAGKEHPETGVPFERRQVEVDGKQYDVVVPRFESKYDAQLPEDKLKATDREQFKECNAQLKDEIAKNEDLRAQFDDEQLEQIENGDTPDGYTWHHDADVGKMQLVDTETHQKTGHTGGRSIWGGGTENR